MRPPGRQHSTSPARAYGAGRREWGVGFPLKDLLRVQQDVLGTEPGADCARAVVRSRCLARVAHDRLEAGELRAAWLSVALRVLTNYVGQEEQV